MSTYVKIVTSERKPTLVDGPISTVKTIVYAYIAAEVAAGRGAVIVETSADLDQWTKDLMKEFPTTL